MQGEARPATELNKKSLDEVEKQHILAILNSTNGNISKAAAILGVNRVTLYRKLREYNIKTDEIR
jgi:transcriptional regulator of acetoin/glycerol metabolism